MISRVHLTVSWIRKAASAIGCSSQEMTQQAEIHLRFPVSENVGDLAERPNEASKYMGDTSSDQSRCSYPLVTRRTRYIDNCRDPTVVIITHSRF